MFCVLAAPIVNQNPIPAPLGVLKFIPELLAKNNRPGAVRVLRASLWIALIISVMIAGLLYLATPLVIPLLGGSAVLPNFVHLLGFDVVVAIDQVGLAAVIALVETNSAARSIWIWAIARYGLASILLLPLGVVGVLVGWILGDLTLVFFSLSKCLRDNYALSLHSPIPFRSLMSYSGHNLAAALTGFAISFADRLFTLSTQGLSPLAVYNVAIMATTIASSASYALVTVMLPALAGLLAAQNLDELHRLVRLNTRYLSLLVMPIAFGLAAVMDVPLRVFGQAYMSGVGPAVIVCAASGLTAISAVFASALIALGKMRWFTTANLLGLVGFLVVTSVLSPKLGLSGPAFGRATLMIITTLVYGYVAFRAGVFGFDQKAYLVPIAGSAVMALLVFTAISMLHTFPLKLAALPFLMILGILTYLGLLRVSHLISSENLEFIRDITPRRVHSYLPMVAAMLGVRD